MKRIYFIRHAKACQEFQKDFDRKLTKLGKKDAKKMGKRLFKMSCVPDTIYSSDAKRAFKTAKLVAKELRFNKDSIIKTPKLYDASREDYMNLIHGFDNSSNSVFIVGHNMVLTEICELLSDSVIGSIPTAGIFCIDFDVDIWEEVSMHQGRAVFFDYPKKIKKIKPPKASKRKVIEVLAVKSINKKKKD